MSQIALQKTPNNLPAWPIADEALTQKILDIVQQASHNKQLKKGANEGNLVLSTSSDEPAFPLMCYFPSHDS